MATSTEDLTPERDDLTTNGVSPQASHRPLLGPPRKLAPHIAVYLFVIIPPLAVLAAIPMLWGWGLSWADLIQAVIWFTITTLGVTIGFHRYFTHSAFKTRRWLRITLAVVGSLSVQGPVLNWVSDHRRHHAFSDREGDPHSPWLFGTSPWALVRGFFHAHMGWILNRDRTNTRRFAPDLLADKDMRVVSKLFGLLTAATLLLPTLIGGLVTWSWWGALTAFFWAGVVRIAFGHHIAWSTNSVCHLFGKRPFNSRDKSTNYWPLAIPTMGEAWHNYHHADPTSARHGALRGQIDISAWLIRMMEKAGWVWDVRWPTPQRIARLTVAA